MSPERGIKIIRAPGRYLAELLTRLVESGKVEVFAELDSGTLVRCKVRFRYVNGKVYVSIRPTNLNVKRLILVLPDEDSGDLAVEREVYQDVLRGKCCGYVGGAAHSS